MSLLSPLWNTDTRGYLSPARPYPLSSGLFCLQRPQSVFFRIPLHQTITEQLQLTVKKTRRDTGAKEKKDWRGESKSGYKTGEDLKELWVWRGGRRRKEVSGCDDMRGRERREEQQRLMSAKKKGLIWGSMMTNNCAKNVMRILLKSPDKVHIWSYWHT